ncbi:MAG: phosphate acetyltransferase [Clostridia bacterium]|nr:phosphate acetyltransferase [Clostridia bacterium]
MSFIDDLKIRAKKNVKTIVLPEATDIRVLEAAERIKKEEFANIILVGDEIEIKKIADENNIDVTDVKIVNPKISEKYDEYVQKFYELRKAKGMTEEEAREKMLDPVFFGMMIVKNGDADGLVSGAAHSTSDTLRPALQILKTAPGTKLVSAFFLMVVPDCEYGENGVFVFADCGLNPNPNEEELAEIAKSSADSFELLTGKESKIGMLSFSSFGSSARGEGIEKVVNATRIAKERYPELKIDGEMQLDTAIVPEVAKSKAPNSEVAGKCNTLLFPDLQAGNIGYKLVQRLAKAEAYGPICQGIAKPVNDLSRGCTSEDIVGVVAITAVQAQ